MAAPAPAASTQAAAISLGVTGTLSLLRWLWPEPVTAQVMNASQFTVAPPIGLKMSIEANLAAFGRHSVAIPAIYIAYKDNHGLSDRLSAL